MTTWPPPLVCAGRAVDDQLRPVGEPCGATFKPRTVSAPTWAGVWVEEPGAVAADNSFGPVGRNPTPDEQEEQARAAGWSIHLDPGASPIAMCPACRKPDTQPSARPVRPATNATNGAPIQ